VADLKTHLEYIDPNITIWRRNTPDDPYKPRTDYLPVINGIVTLLEVPSERHKVQIPGFTEITKETYKKKASLAENEILVDYAMGIVQFNPVHEGKTFSFTYHGKGLVLIPASRVYAMVQHNPDVVITLQDYIDELKRYTKNLDEKLIELNNVISRTIQAIDNASAAADNANLAAQNANEAAEVAYEAADSAIVIWKDPIDTYDDLEIVYPNPENGWQVTINTTGDIYRYDGVFSHQWQKVGNFLGGSIPYVSEESDGLLTQEDYRTFIRRSFGFQFPSILKAGIQPQPFQCPFDGEIIGVTAFCLEGGVASHFEATIEKISEQDFISGGVWDNIFSKNIIIPAGQLLAENLVIADKEVSRGDYFRVNVLSLDNNIKGINIRIDIKTKNIE
jgi:hypothetical protein